MEKLKSWLKKQFGNEDPDQELLERARRNIENSQLRRDSLFLVYGLDVLEEPLESDYRRPTNMGGYLSMVGDYSYYMETFSKLAKEGSLERSLGPKGEVYYRTNELGEKLAEEFRDETDVTMKNVKAYLQAELENL